MAEITKVTTPMMPKENVGTKFKPVTDQSIDFSDISKVHRTGEESRVMDRQAENQNILRDQMGRAAVAPLLRNMAEVMQTLRKLAVLVQMGVSESDVTGDPAMRELLQSLFLSPEQAAGALGEQADTAVLFKGEVFDALRDILAKFESNPRIRDAVISLLKTFEHNVSAENSIRTILSSSEGILDYMFSKDREQFSNYLRDLADTLLPEGKEQTAAPQAAIGEQKAAEAQAAAEAPEASTPPALREAAQLLKSNLLPLLGEIVVKYNQQPKIRDIVMVVIHNIVRVDQGTPEALAEAVRKLAAELGKVASLPENFERSLFEAVKQNAQTAKNAPNSVVDKLTELVSETLHSQNSSPAALRQAENMMISMLQNQSSMMNVLHFLLPVQTDQGQVFAEVYVDPDSDEKSGRSSGKSRKLFLSVESEAHGAFELSFLETEARVDFSMWCPPGLVKPLAGLRRHVGDMMLTYGYQMNSFDVRELVAPHTIAEVFPSLLEKRVGIDVRI